MGEVVLNTWVEKRRKNSMDTSKFLLSTHLPQHTDKILAYSTQEK